MAKDAEELWKQVDQYITDRLIPADPILEEAQAANAAAGLPTIDVAPNQGKLLHLLARIAGAKKILEIGTLGGYSTTWLARALPEDGRLVTLEFDAKHAEVARKNIARAGLDKVVTVQLGAALDTLPVLVKEGAGPFDLIFIDADKKNLANYLAWSLKLSRKGTLILVDNVIRDGEVIDASSEDPNVQGARQLFDALKREPRLQATALQTIGSKGHDGFAMAVVVE
ncbi:O-methyltransferase [Edaphobacter dinghuensis]|uniref:O-methyltransferase n=1 Tax=Edaphobacter dinghuensis TaxID=1560005 RepID=A0A917LWX8_9BACT|nr:O-methyltransferase [Edaphobacter dinghuensis]GGG64434.1 O-methyltransferase [Edaphobacter dinghuensis]